MFCVPATVLGTLQILPHLTFTITLGSKSTSIFNLQRANRGTGSSLPRITQLVSHGGRIQTEADWL